MSLQSLDKASRHAGYIYIFGGVYSVYNEDQLLTVDYNEWPADDSLPVISMTSRAWTHVWLLFDVTYPRMDRYVDRNARHCSGSNQPIHSASTHHMRAFAKVFT